MGLLDYLLKLQEQRKIASAGKQLSNALSQIDCDMLSFSDGAVAFLVRNSLDLDSLLSGYAPALAISIARKGQKIIQPGDIEPSILEEGRIASIHGADLWKILGRYMAGDMEGYLGADQLPRRYFLDKGSETPGEICIANLVGKAEFNTFGVTIPFLHLPLQEPGEIVASSLARFLNAHEDVPEQVITYELDCHRIHDKGSDSGSPNFRVTDYNHRVAVGVTVMTGPRNRLAPYLLSDFLGMIRAF